MRAIVNDSKAVSELARRVESDIQLRGLAPGDRYLTSDEAQKAFRVGKGVVNRALRLLTQRKVLVRRQKSGTFVGPKGGTPSKHAIRTFFVLLPSYRKDLVDVPFDLFLQAFQSEFPLATVHFGFVPEQNGVEYVDELIAASQAEGRFAGVVPISCSTEIGARLADAGVPMVAFTAFYTDGRQVVSVDTDRFQAGQLLVKHLIERGHRRIALFNFSNGQPGDHDFYDGVSEEMSAARLPHNALIYRDLPAGIAMVAGRVRELFAQPNPPTAFIARSSRIADVVEAAVKEFAPQADVEIVFMDHATDYVRRSPFTHVRPTLAFEQIARLVVRLLRQLANDEPIDQRNVVIPMELCDPTLVQ